ncbi:hypothetical protein FEE23_05340 [Lactobacillus murinus]|uniref:hypothetical protein n=1 Tax=Ligilactobacillus murinus TaxID=1622 RepID=UPI0013BE1D1E|nr:hypothetical protein [Ligilactobacillus murinus]NEG07485.1 hypothetical protein [Ligilactobacillus murinus]NEG23428.1 hypothetical protein [Ligilactobacillus murinus]NEG30225.1 hypothetical protein [Ligilactobacillus murinus]NEG32440.1 hypothetical protein [Ligilactobacillus murinus]
MRRYDVRNIKYPLPFKVLTAVNVQRHRGWGGYFFVKKGVIQLAVYTGQVAHKLSAKHKTGEKRSILGVTDNKTFGAIFGAFGQVGTISSNGKIQMLEIGSADSAKAELFVDPNELQKISEETFIKNNIDKIKMWAAVANYLEENAYSDMQGVLNQFDIHLDFKTLSNKFRSVIAQFYFRQIDRDAVERVLADETPDRARKDALSRSVVGIMKKGVIGYHGMEVLATVSVFGGKKGISIQNDTVTLNIKVEVDSSMSGSKANIKGPGSKIYKEQFTALKKAGADIGKKLSESKFTHNLRARAPLNEHMDEVKAHALSDTLEVFTLLESSLKGISANDLNLDAIDDFNPATAIKHLWTELHLSSEITFTGFKPKTANKDLRRYWDGEITADEFLQMYSDTFLEQLKTKIATRYKEENVAIDKYVETVFERSKDDCPNIPPEDLLVIAKTSTIEVIRMYHDKILEIKNVREALNLYWSSNTAHDNTIIVEATMRSSANIGRFLSNRDKKLKKDVEKFLKNHLTNIAEEAWVSYLNEHSDNVTEDKKLNLDYKWVDAILSDCIDRLFATADINPYTYPEAVSVFSRDILDPSSDIEPNKWFDEHFHQLKAESEEIKILQKTITDTIIPMVALQHSVNNTTDSVILRKLDKARVELFDILDDYRKKHTLAKLLSNKDYMIQQASKLPSWDEIEQYKIDNLYQIVSNYLEDHNVDNDTSNISRAISAIPDSFKDMYLSYSTNYVFMALGNYIGSLIDVLAHKTSESDQQRFELRQRVKNTIKSASFYFPGEIKSKLESMGNVSLESRYIDQVQDVVIAITNNIYKIADESIAALPYKTVKELLQLNYKSDNYVYNNLDDWLSESINDLDINSLLKGEKEDNPFIEYARSISASDFIYDADNLLNEYLAEYGIKDTATNAVHDYSKETYDRAERIIIKGVYDRATRFLTDKDEQKQFSDPNELMDHAIYDDDDWKDRVISNALDLKDLKYDLIWVVAQQLSPVLPEISTSDISDTLNKLPGYEIFNTTIEEAKSWVQEHLGDDLKSKVFIPEKDRIVGKKIIYDSGLKQLTKYIENLNPRMSQDDIRALNLPKRVEKFVDAESDKIFEQTYALDYSVSNIDSILYANLSPESMGTIYLPQDEIDAYWDNIEDEVISKLNRESNRDDTAYWVSIVHNNLEDASKLFYNKLSVSDFVEKFAN